MKKKSLPQYAAAEQAFGCDPPTVHCPLCGNATIQVGEDGGELTPCSHLEFIYVGETGAFEYQSEDCQEKLKDLDLDELSFENFQESLESAGYGNELLALEVTYGGMACGPVWFTDVYAFHFGRLQERKDA